MERQSRSYLLSAMAGIVGALMEKELLQAAGVLGSEGGTGDIGRQTGAGGCSAAAGFAAAASVEGAAGAEIAAGAGGGAIAPVAALPSDAPAGGHWGGPPGRGATAGGFGKGVAGVASQETAATAPARAGAGSAALPADGAQAGRTTTASTEACLGDGVASIGQIPAAAVTEGAAAGSEALVGDVDFELLSLIAEPDLVKMSRMLSGNPTIGGHGGFANSTGRVSLHQATSGGLGLLPKRLKRGVLAAYDQHSPKFHKRLKDDAETLMNAMSEAARSVACTAACPAADCAGAPSGVSSSDPGRGAHADPAMTPGQVATLWGVLHLLIAEVPLPVGCNNPLCPAAVDEPVATRKCTGCKLAVYCSDACLKEHWEEHKVVCRRVKAARKQAS
jgi:hypothetical protein